MQPIFNEAHNNNMINIIIDYLLSTNLWLTKAKLSVGLNRTQKCLDHREVDSSKSEKLHSL